MASIVDQTGKPIQGEIASIQRDITFPAYFGILMNRDETLMTRQGGKGLRIYDELERDCHAYAVLQKRKMAVVARPWEVQAASTSVLDKKAADMAREHLNAISFDLLTFNALDAILKGFSVGEIMWDIQGNEIGIDTVIPRDARRFTFGLQRELRMYTMENRVLGEPMPDQKFIVHSFGGKDGNPFGLGLGTRLFWPVLFKREDIKFWLTFADKFGSPTMMGTYQVGQTGQKEELLAAMAAIAQDGGIAVPEGVVITMMEAAKSGNTSTYETMAKFMDDQMSEAVLGETMTTSSRGGGLGGNGQANAQNEVRMELVRADADLLSDTLNRTLLTWLTSFNVPGANPPKIRRIVEEQQDLLQRAQRDQVLFAMGRDMGDDAFAQIYGDGYVRKAPAAVTPPTIPGSPQFSENPPSQEQVAQIAMDNAASGIPDDALRAQMDKAIKPVMDMISGAASMDDIMKKLSGIYPDMDASGLEDTLARALFAADVWGRVNAAADQS